MTFQNPVPTATPKTKVPTITLAIAILVGIAILVIYLADMMLPTGSALIPLSEYGCSGTTINAPIDTPKDASIVTTSKYVAGEGITDISISLLPSDKYAQDNYAVTQGRILANGQPLGAFRVDSPGLMKTIHINPSQLQPHDAQLSLELCLLQQ